MNESRLDRLSALLEGLAPDVQLRLTTTDALGAHVPPGAPAFLCLYLLNGSAAEVVAPDMTQPIASPALIAARSDRPLRWHAVQRGAACPLVCGQIRLTGPVAALFLEEFEQPRVVPLSDEEPALRLAMAMIETELNAPRCGQPALLNRAGDILFIGLLRFLVAQPGVHGQGLFNGLADPRIARALVAMHQRPAFAWDLERLAGEAGMSRTAFATTFRQVMKRTPGRYLAAIRLAIAQRAVDLGRGLKEAARTAGYADTSALSRALSRARRVPSGVLAG